MPADRFGQPFFYPSKSGGWFWEQPDSPKSDSGADFSAEFSFPSAGIIKMSPNGPTDFGLGRNISGFSDSIGGCNMDFAATAKRGYAYKANDARDVEIKAIIKADGISSGNGFSISACTGHHQSGSGACCQGFAYMLTTEITNNPSDMRFRKEMWHVSYHTYPGDPFISSTGNLKINGLGRYVGIGFCRYNKPVSGGTSPQDDHVVLEAWFNPDPDANPTNWLMVKRFEDFVGAGFGNDGDQCNGAKDQSGPWSNAQNRFKTNSTSGSILFKNVTLREIDPFGSFETTPPPPDTGGSVTRRLYYGMIGTENLDTTGLTRSAAHEIVETITDPDPLNVFHQQAWGNVLTGDEIADECTAASTFADGLTVEGYWSNSDNNCVVPRINYPDLGSSSKMTNRHAGPVLAAAKVYLIYWGADWETRSVNPTAASFTDLIQNKLLGSDKEYFARLTQYDNIAAPTWGKAVFNKTFPIPTATNINESVGRNVIIDSFNKGLLSIPTNPNQDVYILIYPVGKGIIELDGGTGAQALHDLWDAVLTIPPPITDPPVVTPPPTPTTSRVHGFLSLLWDINTVSGSGACTGTGGGGGGPSGDLIKIYDEPADEANERALSDTTAWKNRKRVTEQIMTSDSVLKGQVVKQFDVPLKKAGSPVGTVFARIWSSSSTPTVLYTSPTTFDPSTFTTSFVTKTFDFSTNTHAIQVGERIGIEYQTTSDVNFVRTSFDDNTTTRSEMVTYEGSSWNVITGKDIAATMWA